MKPTLISIIGATGIGKTRLAIKVAQFFNTEIISCDSRQFFKEIPIGTAAPSADELSAVTHHFIGHRSVTEDYSIGQYEEDALKLLKTLFKKHHVVVMVGGSGMYEKAVVEGLNNLPKAHPEHQKKLEHILNTEGVEGLQNILKSLDKAYYQIVDKDNPRRLIRAIDIIWQTDKTYTQILSEEQPHRDFDTIRLQIDAPREIIYERINRRVDKMMDEGLLDEVKALWPYQNLVALQTVGYKELFHYLNGDWTLDFAVDEIKKNSRRYAKRQLTWNRKIEGQHHIPYDYSDEDLVSLLHNLNLK